jgi:ABC-type proline/glycine betaine transport system permease subunit
MQMHSDGTDQGTEELAVTYSRSAISGFKYVDLLLNHYYNLWKILTGTITLVSASVIIRIIFKKSLPTL